MRATITSAIAAALIGGAAAIVAAPSQTTQRPGDMTRADVWIQNTENEPIPARLRPRPDDPPLRVLVANGESPPALPLRVRVSAPIWEYRTVTIKAADDPANALVALGADGWEVTGLQWPAPDGARLLLKRAR